MANKKRAVGFDADFVNPLDDRYKCTLCLLALREPQQTSCGHRICRSCFESLKGESGGNSQFFCPTDGEVIDPRRTFPDTFASREILSLATMCRYRRNGCLWMNELRNYENHINGCSYGEINCPNPGCEQRVQRRQLPYHLAEHCLFRITNCEYCSSGVPYSLLVDHQEECPQFPSDCQNNCGAKVMPRQKLAYHYSAECPNAEGSCPFSFAGCSFKGTHAEVKVHLQNVLYDHINLAAEQTKALDSNCNALSKRLDRESAKVKSLEAKLVSIDEAFKCTRDEYLTVQTKLVTIQDEIETLCRSNAELSEKLTSVENNSGSRLIRDIETFKTLIRQNDEKVKQLEKQVKEPSQFRFEGIDLGFGSLSLSAATKTPRNIEKRVDRIENQLALEDVQLAELNLKLQLMESTSYDGTLIWKIDNFNRRRHDAIIGKTPSLYSPPFFTSRFGYKMCARIYLNGDGMGKGTHISLFFVLMRSEWDALLPFPFHQKITLKLLDQESDKSIVESFRPDPHSSSFRRPMTDMNIASGCPLFVAHDKLMNGSYVKDDSIFLVISVDTSGLPQIEPLRQNKGENALSSIQDRERKK